MSAIYITEADVERLATVKDAIAALEELFATWGHPLTNNIPRHRARLPGGALNLMGGSYGAKSVYGLNAGVGVRTVAFATGVAMLLPVGAWLWALRLWREKE